MIAHASSSSMDLIRVLGSQRPFTWIACLASLPVLNRPAEQSSTGCLAGKSSFVASAGIVFSCGSLKERILMASVLFM